MRVLVIARLLIVAVVLAATVVVSEQRIPADAAEDNLGAAPFAQPAHAGIDVDIDGDEDDVLEVQLLVLGLVIGTVFVLGTGAYLLRRKLGLTAYTPPADTGHH